MTRPGYARKFRPLNGNPVRRGACAFAGCVMPPHVYRLHGRVKSRSLCSAHIKQRKRGQTLRPFKPRTDVSAAWERWAKLRSVPSRVGLRIAHIACGETMSVIATNPNGKRGTRYCYCSACEVRVVVEVDGSQRAPREVRA